jgi:hypothetical protein
MIIRRSVSVVLSIGAALACWGVPISARANPSKQQCVDDNASAQELRRNGHFAEASERLERCALPACPAIVSEDCNRRLDDLKGAQPTLVFEVRSPSGVDIVSVRVSVDGQLLTDHLNGTPLKIDPGPHIFTFEVPGQPVVTERLLAREGERVRHERLVIGGSPTPPLSESPGRSTRQVIGLSAGALGVASVVVGTVLGLTARSAWTEAKSACGGDPSHCLDVPTANSRRSEAVTAGTISTAAFVAGGALIAAGAFLYLTRSEGPEKKPEGVALGAAVDSGRVGIVLQGLF